MDELLKIMRNSNARNADGVTENDWASPRNWAEAIFGKCDITSSDEWTVKKMLIDLEDECLVESENMGEGKILYRAVVA